MEYALIKTQDDSISERSTTQIAVQDILADVLQQLAAVILHMLIYVMHHHYEILLERNRAQSLLLLLSLCLFHTHIHRY